MSDSQKSVLILGGGVAGLSAARTLNERGVVAHLVEKDDHLGGKALNWACMATKTCENCGACLTAELVDQVSRQAHTTVYTQTELSGLDRNSNGFEAVLTGEFSGKVPVDAVLMATGFSPFDPSVLKSLGYGRHEKVITTVELNDMLKMGRISKLLSGQNSPKIAFIQCVGSRNRKLDRNYCSQVCCKISLRHANKLIHLYPEADITVLHMDLQVIGKEFRTFTEKLAKRIKLVQGVAAEIVADRQDGKLTIFHEDETIGVRTAHHFDLIVLSVGLGASENVGELALKLGVKPDPWGFLSHSQTDFPKGIYAAGTTRGPMNILNAISEGRITATRIVNDLNIAAGSDKKFRVAVVGAGNEAVSVSNALSKEGYPVVLIDSGNHAFSTNEHIKHLSNARLVSTEGTVGNFTLGITNGKGNHKESVGAVVVANGVARLQPEKNMISGRVVTFASLENYPEEKIPNKLAFWMDYSGPENKNIAGKILEMATSLAGKGKIIYVLMEKMLVHGLMGQKKYDAARKAGIKFLRVLSRTSADFSVEGEQIKLAYEDITLPGVKISVSCDMLVIPEKVEPSEDTSLLTEVLNQAVDAEGFIQSANSRHRPVASPRKGIFFAGSCHDEIDGDDLATEILAILAGLGYLGENGSPQGQAARIFENECIKCLTCIRVCPHGAVVLLSSNKPQIIPEACFECGLCVSNCPAKAIRQEAFLDEKLVEGAKDAETFIFACERSAFLAKHEARRLGLELNQKVHVQSVRCTGRIGIENMFAPLLKGAGRVIVAGCHEGNCRSMESGNFAGRRIEHTLTDLGMDANKLSFHPVAANEPEKFKKITSDTE
jgi:heterodisulfide reductase subunit A-like polyferredoxin/coenzyme F420-reducing hydrogenase delta subunit